MNINVIQCVYHGKIVSQTLYIMVKKNRLYILVNEKL